MARFTVIAQKRLALPPETIQESYEELGMAIATALNYHLQGYDVVVEDSDGNVGFGPLIYELDTDGNVDFSDEDISEMSIAPDFLREWQFVFGWWSRLSRMLPSWPSSLPRESG